MKIKFVYDWQFSRAGSKLLKVERNKLNPLPGLTFVSIAYWDTPAGIVGVIF